MPQTSPDASSKGDKTQQTTPVMEKAKGHLPYLRHEAGARFLRNYSKSGEGRALTKHGYGGLQGLSQKAIAQLRAVRRSHAVPLCRLS